MKAIKIVAATVVIATSAFGAQAQTVGDVAGCGGFMMNVGNGIIVPTNFNRGDSVHYSMKAMAIIDNANIGISGSSFVKDVTRQVNQKWVQASMNNQLPSQNAINNRATQCVNLLNSLR
jgi:hypothetical protein